MTENLKIWFLFFTFWASGVVFVWPMERKKNFWRKISGVSVVIWVGFFVFLYFLWDGQIWMEVLAKNVCNVMMVVFLYCCWEISMSVALYNMIWAASLWQLLMEVWKVTQVFGENLFNQSAMKEVLGMLVLFGGSYFICINTIAKWMPADRKKKIGPRQSLSAILVFEIIQMLSYAPALRSIDTYNQDWKFLYLSQMICIVILYLQNELFKKSDMKQELQLMNLLWKMEQEQYHLTKENIALINQKSHDLKHQIKALRKASKEEYDKYLDEMEDSVRIYEAIVKTGNDVLDTILTEKSLYCKDKEIQVSCVAEGKQMDFVNTIDLYAILGNALDNAIEAVEKFEEREKRQIDVLIYRKQNFLVINIMNPIPERLVYEEELPVTTKGDRKFHGFGLRSIQYLVRKYDGVVNISEEDGCFSLKILMPIPNEKMDVDSEGR